MVIDGLLAGYAVLILLFAGYEKLTLVGFPTLPEETISLDSPPQVSIILPVRNQAATVEECLSSLVALDYSNKEIIVVEGGSIDQTSHILSKFQDKINIVREQALPEGWVGKNWACHLGYQKAQGQILLFTDGDSVHTRDSLSRTVRFLETSGADLVTLAPATILRSFWEKLLQPAVFYLIVLFVGGKFVNDDNKTRNSIGNGQYMLFKRDAYEKIGGHEAVRDRIVEDLSLAKNLKRAGLRLRFVVAKDAFGVRMYSGLREIWAGWRKNFYTVSDNQRLLRAILRLLILFVFFVLPYVIFAEGLFLAPTRLLNSYLVAGAFMCFWLWLSMLIFYRNGANLNPAYGLLLPLVIVIYMGIGVDSTIRGALGIGLSWKGRVYGKNKPQSLQHQADGQVISS